MTTYEIVLKGCTPEPLMNYLKALGILRLVSEQKDSNAKGCWREGTFVLRSSLDESGLIDFLINEYKPTPILVPWSGNDFFGVEPMGKTGPYKETPTSTEIIEAFLATKNARFEEYRRSILCALDCLVKTGIKDKSGMEDTKKKAQFLLFYRSCAPEKVVEWIDTCAVLTDEKAMFSSMLGSGGGSDGNTHFSENFMKNLWDVLPDFDDQHVKLSPLSLPTLRNTLFGELCSALIPKRTSALFNPGAVGGPNAGYGFNRISLGNPWSIILCLEGTIFLAGCLARREKVGKEMGIETAKGNQNTDVHPSFPFQVRLTPTRFNSISAKESSGRELWMPLWAAWSSKVELMTLFSEGRASLGTKQVERGVDFARAVASLGVDRGIEAFQRFAIVRGRVGGDNYNTSVPLGVYAVNARPNTDLLLEIDLWLDRFRRAAEGRNAPPRFGSALRRIESAVFDYCQYGGAARFSEILCSLGQAERELSVGGRKKSYPIANLSPEWLRAVSDNSPEFELALALSGIYDSEFKIGPLRSNLEPVGVDRRGEVSSNWVEKDRAMVWNSRNLVSNMVAVLERRLMDGKRKGCEKLPLSFRSTVSLETIARFLNGETDDGRIEELLWGLILVEQPKAGFPPFSSTSSAMAPLPRSFALLKLLLLPGPLKTPEGSVSVKLEPRVLPLLRAGRLNEACTIASRRLRASGFVPMTAKCEGFRISMGERVWGEVDPLRLAAALLLPVSEGDVTTLSRLIFRQAKTSKTNAV